MASAISPEAGRRVRVLQVIARLNVGGPASQVLALADGLDPERYRVEVVAGAPAVGEADYLAVRGGHDQVRYAASLSRSVRAGADLRALRYLDTVIRSWRPDLVHTHTAKAGVLGRVAARRAGIPCVHTFHGHLLHGYFGPATTRAVVGAERLLAPRTERLIAVGERVRDELLAAGVGAPAQYRVMAPAVSARPRVDRAEARRSLELAPDAAVLGYVARLTAIKRPDRLVAVARDVAARRAAEGRGPLTVLVAGDGELADTVRGQARRAGLDVRLLGWRADVETVHAASDLLLLTSDNEGMPVALAEAALAGVPAVAIDVGSVGEVVDHGCTGLLAPPGDVAALSVAVAELLGDPDRRARMGASAAERAQERFAPARLVAATDALYDEVLRSTAGR